MKEPLNILYQDEWLVAIDKPAGHLVHPASEPQEGDLVAMKLLRDQIGQRVHSIHRLDRPTSGVLLFGIDKAVSRQLHKALERHEMTKQYLAVVNGAPEWQKWDCHATIQKEEGAPIRDAHTSFELIETQTLDALDGMQSNTLSLLWARPHTGRFHQIRRHLEEVDLPIVGDFRYAGVERSTELGARLETGTRMMLQAKILRLHHPVTGGELVIEAPVSESIKRCFPNMV